MRLLLAFAETVRHGGFARAARELGLSPSAVAKAVQRLEARLGVRLFHRTTRRIGLTHEGEELYARCRRILDELDELERVAARGTQGARGTLRIDAPATWGRQVLLPVLAQLAAKHPELALDLRLSDLQSDVTGGGLDAVVRIGRIDDSRLVARQVDAQHFGVFGAPAYLVRRGVPRTPAELVAHDCLVFRLPATGRPRPWQFRSGRRTLALDPGARATINDGEALVAAAAAGLGLAQVPVYMAAPAVAAGRLQEVLAEARPPPLPISIVYPSSRHVPPRLRVLIDALLARTDIERTAEDPR